MKVVLYGISNRVQECASWPCPIFVGGHVHVADTVVRDRQGNCGSESDSDRLFLITVQATSNDSRSSIGSSGSRNQRLFEGVWVTRTIRAGAVAYDTRSDPARPGGAQ